VIIQCCSSELKKPGMKRTDFLFRYLWTKQYWIMFIRLTQGKQNWEDSHVLLTPSSKSFRFESWEEMLILLSSSVMFCILVIASLAVAFTSEAPSLAWMMRTRISSKKKRNHQSVHLTRPLRYLLWENDWAKWSFSPLLMLFIFSNTSRMTCFSSFCLPSACWIRFL